MATVPPKMVSGMIRPLQVNGDGCHEAVGLKGTHHTSSTDRRHHHPLEHQEGCDGMVSVKLAAAPPPMMVVVKPVAHGLGINPEGE